MYQRYTVLLALAATLLVAASSASAGQKQKIWPFPVGINVTCPRAIQADVVMRGCTLVVKNNTTHVFRRLNLDFTPRNVIVKSGLQFTTIRLQAYTPSTTAKWILRGLQPKTTMKIAMTLKVPGLPLNTRPKGIFLDGQELGGGAFGHNFVPLRYKATG